MNRERFAWITSVVLVALLAFQLPGTLAHRDDDYAFVGTLMTVHRHLVDNYAEPVDEEKLRKGAIDGMLGQLDPYTVYVPPAEQEKFERLLQGSYKGVGIQLDQNEQTKEIEVVTPIEESPAHRAGVLAGDVILKVNGEDIRNLKIEEVMAKVKGPVGSEVRITVRHTTGEEAELTMTRQEIVMPTVKGYRRNEDNSWDYFVNADPRVGYVRVTQFTPETTTKLRAAVEKLLAEGMKGLILDLRFNPGGRLDQAEEVVDLFLDQGTVVVTRGRNRPEKVTQATGPGTLPPFPMVVLINEHSASASEIVAGSLMDNRRALVLGTRSYGKGSVQEVVDLDRGGELKVTVGYYYLPSGRLVHRKKDAADWGVEPQIIVPMDEATQQWLYRNQTETEYFRKPKVQGSTTAPTTRAAAAPATGPSRPPGTALDQPPPPATRPAGTQPTTGPATQPAEPTDAQLDAAISTMIGHIVLAGERKVAAGGAPDRSASQPARE
ncbi:MAG TPA: S41 family peptidase [Tepidisphaeraceae bacterium]|nr:S41 family peptidase [Tepidisphaeraceae bacterium]